MPKKSKKPASRSRSKKITTTQRKQPPIKLTSRKGDKLEVNIVAKERRRKRPKTFAEKRAEQFRSIGVADLAQLRQQRGIASDVLGYRTSTNDPVGIRQAGGGRYNQGGGVGGGISERYAQTVAQQAEGGGLITGVNLSGGNTTGGRRLNPNMARGERIDKKAIIRNNQLQQEALRGKLQSRRVRGIPVEEKELSSTSVLIEPKTAEEIATDKRRTLLRSRRRAKQSAGGQFEQFRDKDDVGANANLRTGRYTATAPIRSVSEIAKGVRGVLTRPVARAKTAEIIRSPSPIKAPEPPSRIVRSEEDDSSFSDASQDEGSIRRDITGKIIGLRLKDRSNQKTKRTPRATPAPAPEPEPESSGRSSRGSSSSDSSGGSLGGGGRGVIVKPPVSRRLPPTQEDNAEISFFSDSDITDFESSGRSVDIETEAFSDARNIKTPDFSSPDPILDRYAFRDTPINIAGEEVEQPPQTGEEDDRERKIFFQDRPAVQEPQEAPRVFLPIPKPGGAVKSIRGGPSGLTDTPIKQSNLRYNPGGATTSAFTPVATDSGSVATTLSLSESSSDDSIFTEEEKALIAKRAKDDKTPPPVSRGRGRGRPADNRSDETLDLSIRDKADRAKTLAKEIDNLFVYGGGGGGPFKSSYLNPRSDSEDAQAETGAYLEEWLDSRSRFDNPDNTKTIADSFGPVKVARLRETIYEIIQLRVDLRRLRALKYQREKKKKK